MTTSKTLLTFDFFGEEPIDFIMPPLPKDAVDPTIASYMTTKAKIENGEYCSAEVKCADPNGMAPMLFFGANGKTMRICLTCLCNDLKANAMSSNDMNTWFRNCEKRFRQSTRVPYSFPLSAICKLHATTEWHICPDESAPRYRICIRCFHEKPSSNEVATLPLAEAPRLQKPTQIDSVVPQDQPLIEAPLLSVSTKQPSKRPKSSQPEETAKKQKTFQEQPNASAEVAPQKPSSASVPATQTKIKVSFPLDPEVVKTLKEIGSKFDTSKAEEDGNFIAFGQSITKISNWTGTATVSLFQAYKALYGLVESMHCMWKKMEPGQKKKNWAYRMIQVVLDTVQFAENGWFSLSEERKESLSKQLALSRSGADASDNPDAKCDYTVFFKSTLSYLEVYTLNIL
jgi:uncharacterized protein (DUF4415 family)